MFETRLLWQDGELLHPSRPVLRSVVGPPDPRPDGRPELFQPGVREEVGDGLHPAQVGLAGEAEDPGCGGGEEGSRFIFNDDCTLLNA